MMGKRSPQDTLFAADHVFLDYVGRDTVYGGCGSDAGHFSPIRVEQVAKPGPDGEEAYAEARGGRS
jgi:hypothetical protein